MSEQQPTPLSAKKPAARRSRTGCWTCRARRKKCDEKRPECMQCVNKGLSCAGYGARLKWGNGVASRGYLTGKSVPIMGQGNAEAGSTGASTTTGDVEALAERRVGAWRRKKQSRERGAGKGKGEQLGDGEMILDFATEPAKNENLNEHKKPERHEPDAAHAVVDGNIVDSSPGPELPPLPEQKPVVAEIPAGVKLSDFDAMLFDEFQEWGAFYLWVTADPSKPPFYDVFTLCAQSRSLLANCLTFQLSLHPEYEDKFESYYAESLRLFRQDVCEVNNAVKDATLVSGILLCSIGMTRCMPWTIHLSGMYSILQYRDAVTNPTPITSDVVDTIGFLDMPTHILGRQSQTLNIWRDYCRGKSGIESVSGLPYGLLDLFSSVAEPDVEFQFWTWTGAGIQAMPVQRRAWDAIRFAGVLSAIQYHQENGLVREQTPTSSSSTETLVQAILDCLNDFLQKPGEDAFTVVNLLLYPVFMAGTQTAVLSAAQKSSIEEFWKVFLLGDETGEGSGGGAGSASIQAPLDILREMWTNSKGRTADQIAREWEIEVGLF